MDLPAAGSATWTAVSVILLTCTSDYITCISLPPRMASNANSASFWHEGDSTVQVLLNSNNDAGNFNTPAHYVCPDCIKSTEFNFLKQTAAPAQNATKK
jgi:hypothetical protein